MKMKDQGLIDQMAGLTQEEVIAYLDTARQAYYDGEEIISDETYEAIVDLLPDPQGYRDTVGAPIDASRKRKLPVVMASMTKTKSVEDLMDWAKSKKIPLETEVVLTPKFDGASLLVNLKTIEAFTRGDGKEGQLSTDHFEEICGMEHYTRLRTDRQLIKPEYVNGEVMMTKKVFADKYAQTYKNSRNLVAGLLNGKEVSPILRDCVFIAYGWRDGQATKCKKRSDQLDFLNGNINSGWDYPCLYHITTLGDLTQKLLQNLKTLWECNFNLDGIIVEVNDLELYNKLGRETSSNNPCGARAWKGYEAECAITTIRSIDNQVSKWGELRPVANVDPVELDGVTVSRVTLKNYKNIQNLGLGVGAEVDIIRSGGVIPEVRTVTKKVKTSLPTECPACASLVEWDTNSVHLVCSNADCETRSLHKVISFFEILEVEGVGQGVVEQLVDAGYKTVADICQVTVADLKKMDRFGTKKAENTHKNIHAKLKDVPLEKLQHASGFFRGLGSKKLALFVPFYAQICSGEINEVREALLAVEGISDKSIESYMTGIDLFVPWVVDIPVSIATTKAINKVGSKCDNMVFVFTGFRDKDAETKLEEQGAKIGSSVSKNTTHLVMKEKGSGSSKEKKATSLGITIWDKHDLEKFLGGKGTATNNKKSSDVSSIWED
jgi:DNA ligase (NAD+)